MIRFVIGTALALGALAVPGIPNADPPNRGSAIAREPVVLPADTVQSEDPPRVYSSGDDRESLSITVYNQNFGLVREVRSIPVGVGPVEIEYGDVASAIQTETVHVRPLGGGFQLLFSLPDLALDPLLGRQLFFQAVYLELEYAGLEGGSMLVKEVLKFFLPLDLLVYLLESLFQGLQPGKYVSHGSD